uniref:Homing endonuclease LAGLIDADG domain-containing protein n=1 Tax=Juglanconis juglandina TaxID=1940567 RepID=A0A291LJ27_9PEZI|nr:hypothetical protein [Juglanconis juglandina]
MGLGPKGRNNLLLIAYFIIIPEFRIELHSRDTLLLRKIQSYFGLGIISERLSLNKVVYSVQSYKDIINVIIPHFDQYPLVTQKKADYLLFKQAINLLNLKAKSNIEGFRSILSLKASMNSGLSSHNKKKCIFFYKRPRWFERSEAARGNIKD